MELSRERSSATDEFDALRSRLLPVVYYAAIVEHEQDVLRQVLGAGLYAALAVPHGQTTRMVTTSQARGWRIDLGELWAIALHNLRRRPLEKWTVDGGPGPMTVVDGVDPCIAANLLRLDELADGPTPYGMLVAAPSVNVIIFSPFRDPASVMNIQRLEEAIKVYWDNPWPSLTQRVLWWTREPGIGIVLEPISMEKRTTDHPSGEWRYTVLGSGRFKQMCTEMVTQMPRGDG
jgi:hypothetical protein